MKLKTISFCLLLLLFLTAQAQFSPPGSPQFHYRQQAGNGICPYLFIGGYRVRPPFLLRATNMLLDDHGDLVWYQQLQQNTLDFKLHANGRMAYSDNVRWHILDSNFAQVDSVECVGYRNDPHDFRMTADGHYWLICIEDSVVDLSSLMTTGGFPGSATGRLDGVVIQELDAAKQVVREWHGMDHYNIQDPHPAYFQNPSILELNHTNSIDMNGQGKVLLSHRALNEICQVDWATGQIDWHLGGSRNQFDLMGDGGTIGQHDARYSPGDRISTFDNGNLARPWRALVYSLDTVLMRAYIAAQYSDGTTMSDAMGSLRVQPDGSVVIATGRPWPASAASVLHVTPSLSGLHWNLRFLDSSSTYRAFCSDLPFALQRPHLTCSEVSGQVVLGVDGLHSAYQWTTGEQSATIVVADTGWYQAFVPQGVGMMSTPAYHITDLANACLALPAPGPAAAGTPRRISLGIWDLLGRPVIVREPGQIYVERFSDGSSRKFVWLK